MKKLAIASIIISTLGLGTAAHAGENTITVGYAQSKIQDFKNINGVNLKYRYEWDSPFSVITSFTYMSGDQDYSYLAAQDIIDNHAEAKYYSLAAGPAYRINEYISVYGLLGVNYNKVNYKYHWWNYEGGGYRDMGETSGSSKNASLMYGAGVQINPIANLAIDIGYEGSSLDDGSKSHSVNGFNINFGYRF